MEQWGSNHWSILCKFVQWSTNTTVHKAIGDLPYRQLTGQNPRVGITSIPIDPTLVDHLFTERQVVQSLGLPESALLDHNTFLPVNPNETAMAPMSSYVASQDRVKELEHRVNELEGENKALRSQMDLDIDGPLELMRAFEDGCPSKSPDKPKSPTDACEMRENGTGQTVYFNTSTKVSTVERPPCMLKSVAQSSSSPAKKAAADTLASLSLAANDVMPQDLAQYVLGKAISSLQM